MAVKKEAAVTENVNIGRAEEVDPWKQRVTIKLDKALPGEDNYVIASVNGKTFKIKKGVAVDVPVPIAEVIEHSREAEEAADMYIESKAY